MTMFRVKTIQSQQNVNRETFSLPSCLVMLQVIHQRNEFWMSPKELEFFSKMWK